MSIIRLQSFAEGHWFSGDGSGSILASAIDGAPVAEITAKGLDVAGMMRFAREKGGRPCAASPSMSAPRC